MPLYTYRCDKCGIEIDVRVPIANRDGERLHSCGSTMTRKLGRTLTPIMKQTGREMAADTLNSGIALPNRWYKDKDERGAARGLEKPPKRVW